jgi:lysozyme family protein
VEIKMARFDLAVALTLVHEGGYVDNPIDKGGPTNFGITQADMPGVDMRTITREQAIAYYAAHYWNKLYDGIVDQPVANKLFDMGVLTGPHVAVKLLQQVLGVVADGTFGPKSLATTNVDGPALLGLYRPVLRQHFIDLVAKVPQDETFLKGWENRVDS